MKLKLFIVLVITTGLFWYLFVTIIPPVKITNYQTTALFIAVIGSIFLFLGVSTLSKQKITFRAETHTGESAKTWGFLFIALGLLLTIFSIANFIGVV